MTFLFRIELGIVNFELRIEMSIVFTILNSKFPILLKNFFSKHYANNYMNPGTNSRAKIFINSSSCPANR